MHVDYKHRVVVGSRRASACLVKWLVLILVRTKASNRTDPRSSRFGRGFVTNEIIVLRGIDCGNLLFTFRPYGSRSRRGMNITLRRSMHLGSRIGVSISNVSL